MGMENKGKGALETFDSSGGPIQKDAKGDMASKDSSEGLSHGGKTEDAQKEE